MPMLLLSQGLASLWEDSSADRPAPTYHPLCSSPVVIGDELLGIGLLSLFLPTSHSQNIIKFFVIHHLSGF